MGRSLPLLPQVAFMRRRPLALVAALITLLAALSAVPAAPGHAAPAAGSPAGSMLTDLSNTADGQLRVTWKQYGSERLFGRYEVITAADRALKVDRVVRRYDTLEQTSVVVPHTASATPASGAYTFVKVLVVRRDGKVGGSWTKWIMPTPPSPPASGPTVDLATFNVLLWRRSQTGPASWKQRLPRIKRRVLAARPGVLLLQEVSGSPQAYGGKRNKTWQFESVAKALRGRYRLTEKQVYRHRGRVRGSQGSRIMYDVRRYAPVRAGHFRQAATSLRSNRWVAWAQLRERSSGTTFYVFSSHLHTERDRPGSSKHWRIRNRQAAQLIAKARSFAATGRSVYVGGDMNSTSTTLPDNGVARAFVAAGFYDGFATRNQVNAQYPTTKDYGGRLTPRAFRRDYLFSLNAPAGSYRFVNHINRSRRKIESDHFMQQAVFPLKP